MNPEPNQQPMQSPTQQPVALDQAINQLSPDQNGGIKYDSNPFTLSFNALGEMFKYAQSVCIIFIVIGLLGWVLNMGADIASFVSDDSDPFYGSSSIEDYADPTAATVTTNSDAVISDSTLSAHSGTSGTTPESPTLIFILVVVAGLLAALLTSSVIGALWGGFLAAGANASFDRRKISAGEAFKEATSNFGALWVASVLSWIRIVSGYLLFIVPGIRAQLRYMYVYNIVLKEKVSGTQAIQRAKELNNGHLAELYGIMFVGGLIPFVGGLLGVAGSAFAYRQIDFVRQNNIATKVHWVNYLLIAIVPLLFLGVVLLAVFVLATFRSME